MNLSAYLQSVSADAPPSMEEEADLLRRIRDDSLPPHRREMAKDKFLRKFIMFVVQRAKSRSRNMGSTAFEELVAAGNVGLMIALNKFDETKGVKFLTYAGWWVDQCQRRAQQEMRLVSMPVWQQQLSARIRKLEAANPEITSEEIQRDHAPDTSLTIINNLRTTQYLTFFLEDLMSSVAGFRSHDNDPDGVDRVLQKASSALPQVICQDFSEGLLEGMEDERTLRYAREHLTAREYEVLCSLLELGDFVKRSLKQLAEDMGLTLSEVRRTKDRALAKMKTYYLKKGYVPKVGQPEGRPVFQSSSGPE